MKSSLSVIAAVFALTLGTVGVAHAEAVFGIGGQSMLTGPSGASLTVDIDKLQIDGIVYAETLGNDTFGGAVRLWYRVHEGESSDLSVGGGIGFYLAEGVDNDSWHIEGGAKLRAFVVPNVALSGVLGLSIVQADDFDPLYGDGGIIIDGQSIGLNAGLGVTYFFR